MPRPLRAYSRSLQGANMAIRALIGFWVKGALIEILLQGILGGLYQVLTRYRGFQALAVSVTKGTLRGV